MLNDDDNTTVEIVPTSFTVSGEGYDNDALREAAIYHRDGASHHILGLGKVLYLTFARSSYLDWGFATYEDYVTNEIGCDIKKAERLRKLWKKVVKDIGLRAEEFVGVDESKIRIVSTVINRNNSLEWVEKAKELTCDDLRAAVKKEKYRLSGKTREIVIVNARTVDDMTAPAVIPERNAEEVTSSILTAGSDKAEVEEKESMSKVSFFLFKDQKEVLNAALMKAERDAQSDKVGHLLTLIMTFYLANRSPKDMKFDKWVEFILKSMELSVGGKFLWIKDKEMMEKFEQFLKESENERDDSSGEEEETGDNI